MIWVVSSWKKGSHEHLIFIILVIHLSIYLLFIRFGLHLLHLTYGLFLEWWMTCLAMVLTWWIAIFQRSSLVLKLINNNFTAWNLIFLNNFFLSFSEFWCLAGKVSYAKQSYLISLHCSWACMAFKSSSDVILDIYFVFFKVVINASYLLGTVSIIFSTILEPINIVPSNLTLLTIVSNLSKYSLIIKFFHSL